MRGGCDRIQSRLAWSSLLPKRQTGGDFPYFWIEEPIVTPEDATMKIKRRGSATWQGGIKDGKGTLSTESGALNGYPYGFASRFEGQRGSNPEELLAAAHAGCFTMALSLILGEAKFTAEKMETTA